MELPRVSLVSFCKFFDDFFVADSPRILTENASKNPPGGSPEAPKTVPERFETHLANQLRILLPKRAAHKVIWGQIWDALEPAGDPKNSKIEPVRFFRRPGRVRERSRIEFLTVADAKPVPTRFLVDFWTPPTLTKHCAWQQI